MIHFKFSNIDQRYLFLSCDTDMEYETLHYQLMPKLNPVDPSYYRRKGAKREDPPHEEFMWEYTNKNGERLFYCSIGMWEVVWRWLKENNMQFDGLDQSYFKRTLPHTFEQFKEIVASWGLSLDPRCYQFEYAYKILQWKKSLSELCTRGGKTLLAYIVFRYAMEYLGVKKILMIVPSIELVKQGYTDFAEYGEFFNSECLWGGGKIVESSNLSIATFQTLVSFLDRTNKKYNPRFFDDYDMVFVDEVHRATAASIKTIISQPFMKNVKICFGMTGTLPNSDTIERYCLNSLIGAKIQQIKAWQLMEAGYISKIQIYQHQIEYIDKFKQIKIWCRCAEYALSTFDLVPNKKNPKKKDKIPLEHPEFLIAYKKTFDERHINVKNKIFSQADKSEWKKYEEWKKYLEEQIKLSTGANTHHIEQMTVHFYEERIDYLIELLKKCPRNTLILATHVEYIKHIGERLKKAFPDRHVVAVYGGSKERKSAKTILKEHNDCIMVANYGIMGTGITLSNLCYGFLFESYASGNINIQSIGRGLGLSDMKEEYVLHDITDKFDSKSASQTIFLQGRARIKIYSEQKYPYKIIKREIGVLEDEDKPFEFEDSIF